MSHDPTHEIPAHRDAAGAAAARSARRGALALVAAAALLTGCVTGGDRPAGGAKLGAAATAPAAAVVDEALIGAPAERVLATLGEPELQRHETPAEIWQYHGEIGGRACVLDVFLYATPEAQTAAAAPAATPVALGQADGFMGLKQVVHLEARDAAAQATDVAPCLDGVVSTRYAS